MTKFIFNNINNGNAHNIFFEFNYGYYPHMLFEAKINGCLNTNLATKLSKI